MESETHEKKQIAWICHCILKPSGGLPERVAATGLLYNSVAVINRQGAILGIYQKHQIVPGDLEGWSNPGLTTPLFVLDTIPIGLLICADAYNPDLANQYAGLGAKILLSSAAWYPGDMGPNGCWEECSLKTQLPFVVCNRTGVEQYSGTDFSQSESAEFARVLPLKILGLEKVYEN